MVKFDLLLLPLIGGYMFLITSYFTKFYHQRLDRQLNKSVQFVLIARLIEYKQLEDLRAQNNPF